MSSGVTRMCIRVPGRRDMDTRIRSRVTGPGVVGVMGDCSSKTFFCRRKTVWLACDESAWWQNDRMRSSLFVE